FGRPLITDGQRTAEYGVERGKTKQRFEAADPDHSAPIGWPGTRRHDTRTTHNPKVAGSNPAPATEKPRSGQVSDQGFIACVVASTGTSTGWKPVDPRAVWRTCRCG